VVLEGAVFGDGCGGGVCLGGEDAECEGLVMIGGAGFWRGVLVLSVELRVSVFGWIRRLLRFG
jgi:hypothetical protein